MPLKRYLAFLRGFDWVLFGSIFLLITFGLAAIYSITISAENPDFTNFKKQIFFSLIGFILLFLVSLFDYRVWRDYSHFIYGAVGLLLIAVLFIGTTIRGTTGWFSFFGVNFQPVEIAKIALILILAWFLSNRPSGIKDIKTFLITAGMTGLFFILVILQPDFGSAIILFSIWILMIIFAGCNKKHLLVLGLLFIIAFSLAWVFMFKDYQKDRILTFFDPQADPYNRGYHVRQSVTAIGAGGFLGRGLGFGSQSQLKFIPASHTDFIFAVIAEELGLLGVSLILFFWGLIFYRLIKAAVTIKDSFSSLFILGVSAIFFIQIVINIGMNIGIVPVTGISLPFVSYGGSFLVVSLLLIGMAESMIIRNQA